MCDLWKNTLDSRMVAGNIPYQMEWALERLQPSEHLKLYNNGNFFDRRAILPSDYNSIKRIISSFKILTIENHPDLTDHHILSFKDGLAPSLEIAMGLETVNEEVLPLLNKKMTLVAFEKATRFLIDNDINVRAFILLRPPFLTEEEGVVWAKKSIDFAFNIGIECCSIIPTRPGNGAIEWLESKGRFQKPTLASLEDVLVYGLQKGQGRVLADLWDLNIFSTCSGCYRERYERLKAMNLSQQPLPPASFTCECTR